MLSQKQAYGRQHCQKSDVIFIENIRLPGTLGIHEEAPEAVTEAIRSFMARNP